MLQKVISAAKLRKKNILFISKQLNVFSLIFKVGLYQESIKAYEVVTGDGSFVRATKDNEHRSLLFHKVLIKKKVRYFKKE